MRSLAGLAAAVALSASACSGGHSSPAVPGRPLAPPSPSTDAARRFLSRYVMSDGRVLRLDQGGDIVSEGEALAMLAAEIAKQPATVRVVWAWTSQHLRRPDGLLAFHASGDGTILDPQPAPDADILIAYALLRYGGPDARALHNGGTRLASSVMRLESVTAPGGAPVIAAGLWAMGAPVTIDPSYWMPPVFRALATLTGDQRWSHSADASVTLVDRATTGGRLLPADWAHLDGSRLDPIPAPSGGAAARYGLDAARLPVWFAVDCSAPARRLAASWWNDVLSVDDRTTPIALSLKGQVMDPSTNPLPLVAGAAAAEAAGDGSRVAQLRANAVSQAERTPTYYGDAWLALGEALLDRTLTVC